MRYIDGSRDFKTGGGVPARYISSGLGDVLMPLTYVFVVGEENKIHIVNVTC